MYGSGTMTPALDTQLDLLATKERSLKQVVSMGQQAVAHPLGLYPQAMRSSSSSGRTPPDSLPAGPLQDWLKHYPVGLHMNIFKLTRTFFIFHPTNTYTDTPNFSYYEHGHIKNGMFYHGYGYGHSDVDVFVSIFPLQIPYHSHGYEHAFVFVSSSTTQWVHAQ
jgi:hypothetical protein